MEKDEVDYIKNELYEVFATKKDVEDDYVKKEDCTESKFIYNERLVELDKKVLLATHDMDVIKKLLWVIATATIGQLVAILFLKVLGV